MEQRKLGDVDGLYVHKFLDAVGGKLSSVAAVLDAAEGKARVGAHGFVDEDATALDPFGGDVLAPRQVAGDDPTAQPEHRIVGGRDRLLLVLHRDDGGNRSEQLFLVG